MISKDIDQIQLTICGIKNQQQLSINKYLTVNNIKASIFYNLNK